MTNLIFHCYFVSGAFDILLILAKHLQNSDIKKKRFYLIKIKNAPINRKFKTFFLNAILNKILNSKLAFIKT